MPIRRRRYFFASARFAPCFRRVRAAFAWLFVGGVSFFLSHAATAQTLDSAFTLPSWLSVSGAASVFGELYLSPGGASARRPPGTARLSVQTTLTLFEQFAFPFELLLSTEQAQFRQPFNQFSFAPRFGEDVQLFAGFHNIALSSFSAGDVRINGGGAIVKWGNLRLTASVGLSRLASLPDTTRAADSAQTAPILPPYLQPQAAFAQTMIAGRAAYEFPNGGAVVGVNVVRARDDASSVDNSLLTTPLESKDNFTVAVDCNVPLVRDALIFAAEIAGSRNGSFWIRPADPECGFGEPVFRIAADNFRLDYAAKFSLSFEESSSPVIGKIRAEYVGPGFTTAGFPQLPNDRFETDLALQTRLFDNNLSVSGSIGYAADNLAQDREITTGRLIGSLNLSAQITQEIGVDAQFQNYGIRTALPPNYGIFPPDPTPPGQPILQTQQIFNLVSIMPRFTFMIDKTTHNVNLSASAQEFADANAETRSVTQNASQSLRLLWSAALDKLALTLNVGYTANESALAQFRATEISLTGGYPLIPSKLTPSLTLSWTRSSESSGLESRSSATLRANYRLTNKTDVVLNAQANYYAYRPGGRLPSYAEGQISLELRQRF
jgi:hypothetical protein